MANSVFDMLGNNNSLPFGNMQNFMQKFNQFKSTFSGNPQQRVQELLNSGQMTQAQFNQLAQQATQIQKMFSGK